MIDIKLIRTDIDKVKAALGRRPNVDLSLLDKVLMMDEQRREVQLAADNMKAQKNALSKDIGKRKSGGEDVSGLLKEVAEFGDKVASAERRQEELEQQIHTILSTIPNIPDESVPTGIDEKDNVCVKTYGTPREYNFPIKPHWDVAKDLDILDFERAAKMTGTRFVVYKDQGAKLERALINFMLTVHEKKGYHEIMPPLMVNADSMFATGQLPKFEQDLFQLREGYYLISTAEIPLTNLHRGEILKEEQLPLYYTGYTPCFRSEAGAAGRDTRGIIRQHQFNKVELVKLCTPENGHKELELMTNDAEYILQLLGLSYRVVALSSGDMGFSAAKTYDIEVYFPSIGGYREISSCSLCSDFQARRANMRYKDKNGVINYVYTLNGSGLAVGRTFAAVIENYQNADGSVTIPDVLVPFLGFNEIKKGG